MLLIAIWLFAATNLDTFIVLIVFCADDDYRTSEVLFGHYLGFSIGLAGAILAGVLAAEMLREWTFLLGTVPLGMGIWGLIHSHSEVHLDETPPVRGVVGRVGVVTAAGVGLSGENMAVFIPFFAGLSAAELAIIVVVYLVCAGITFVLALVLGRRAITFIPTAWIDRWLVPAILVVVGMYVLVTGSVVA